MFGHEPACSGHESFAHLGSVLHETALDQVQGSERCRDTDRIASKGRAVRAALPRGDRLLGYHRTDWHSRAEPFGSEENIGLYSLVLAGKHLSSTANATLHFIGHQ